MLGLSPFKSRMASKPVNLGSNIVIDNGEFNNLTGWDTSDGVNMTGVATMTTSSPYAFSVATQSVVAGATYRCSLTLVSGGPQPSAFFIQIGGASFTTIPANAANGVYTVDAVANTSDTMVGFNGGAIGMVVDKLTIRQILP